MFEVDVKKRGGVKYRMRTLGGGGYWFRIKGYQVV